MKRRPFAHGTKEVLTFAAVAAVALETLLAVVVLWDKLVGLGLGAALVTLVAVVFVVVVFDADVGLGADVGFEAADLVALRDAGLGLVFVVVVVSEVTFLAVRDDLTVDFTSPLVRGFFSVDLGVADAVDGLGLGEVFGADGLRVVVDGGFAALEITNNYP